ncbi:MAG: hypothetical protein K2N34_03745, partial [Lachnospiraceae bacterium]|nr:hypothetical protein [Lachnospiraceae bacterium]
KYVYWLNKLKKTADQITKNCSEKEKLWIAEAQFCLGLHYESEKIDSEAIKWCKKSAFNGYHKGASFIGIYYKYKKDNQEAIYWLKKCMDIVWEQRGEEYQFAFDELRELGVTYHPGDHVGQNSGSSSASTGNNQNSGSTSHTRQVQQVWKDRWKPCISCDPDRKGRCKQCHGRGYYYIGNIHNICTSCNGTGACVWCGGRGEIKETYSVWE